MSERTKLLYDHFEKNRGRFIEILQRFVSMETPSGEAERIDRFAEQYANLIRNYCDRVSVVAGEVGARVRAETGSGEETVLLLGHMDTVWPLDTGSKPPHNLDGDKLFGPGVFDMKSGLTLALFAFEAMNKLGIETGKKLVFLVTPDEEIGSETSREAIEREAEHASVALVLEPPLADGSMKTRRKGVGIFRLEVRGKESHAGINPWDGVNAVHELAMQISRLVGWNDAEKGITVNVCRAEGGIKDNVVPGKAWASIDFRAMTMAHCREIAEKIRNLKPINKEARLEITGEVNRPPLEETDDSRRIAKTAQEIAAELGVDLKSGLTGGGSDGSFTAAMGVPTIDGLGLDGDGAHSLHEHVLLDRIPFRGALLTELILRI